MNVNINVLDDMGSLLWTNSSSGAQGFAHSPFGSTAARSGGDSLLPGFNGERLDPVSQTYHLGNGYRTYSPTLMRFNAPDSWSPFGGGGLNQYAYCEGDPINRSDPSGHMSAGSILGMTLGIALGFLGAVLSFGTAIPAIFAAEGAVTAAQAALLVSGSMGVVADITGVASTATSETDPQVSRNLGWASLAFGIASAVASGIGDVHGRMAKRIPIDDLSRGRDYVFGDGGAATAGNSANAGSGFGRPIGDSLTIYEGSAESGVRERLIVEADGVRAPDYGTQIVPGNTQFRYFSPDGTRLNTNLADVCSDWIEPNEIINSGGNYKNYYLKNPDYMLSSNYDRWAKKTGVDILLVNKGINFFETKNVLKNLKDAGLNYKIIEWMHCRELAPGTGERYNGVLKRVLPTYV